eukprot:Rhum_TRINITY_DN9804_c0_g1::Rhum_TRINITY_DN9804_c0_g1_i1::g.35316::m.35316
MDGVFIKIKETAGFKEEEPQGFMDEVGDQLSLSWKQRLSCFAGFMAMSIVCYLLSFPWIVLAPKKFAFFFTCANLFGIASTAFLMGPARQLRSMKEHNRLMISTIYVTSMFMTLVAAVQWRELVMVVLFSCVQVAALVWYSLSYIPYARQLASYFLGPLLKVCMSASQVCCVGCGKCCSMVLSR